LSNMQIGYARVCKNDQNIKLQIEALEIAGCDQIFKEISWTKKERPQYLKMTEITPHRRYC